MSVFNEQLHPRGTGALGGQFVAKGSSTAAAGKSGSRPKGGASKGGAGKKPAGGNLSFDGKRGTGYGVLPPPVRLKPALLLLR